MNMGFFNKRSYKLTPEQLKALGLEVIQNQTLKTHKLKTHKLKTHKLKSDKLESREITREELIERIVEADDEKWDRLMAGLKKELNPSKEQREKVKSFRKRSKEAKATADALRKYLDQEK
jgi:hypothetical protein